MASASATSLTLAPTTSRSSISSVQPMIRRPSDIKRKPVPRLSNAEQQLLALHDNIVSSRKLSLASQRSSTAADSTDSLNFANFVFRKQSFNLQPDTSIVLTSPKSIEISPVVTEQSTYCPVVSRQASILSTGPDSASASTSTNNTPLSELASYTFPTPPSAQTDSLPVLKHYGEASGDEMEEKEQSASDARADLAQSTASTVVPSNEIRLSLFPWKSASRIVSSQVPMVPHSRTATEETEYPASVAITPPMRQLSKLFEAASLTPSTDHSRSTSSISDGGDSIFDSYGDSTPDLMADNNSQHGRTSVVSADTQLSEPVYGRENPPKSMGRRAKEAIAREEKRWNLLSTVGEEHSRVRTTDSAFLPVDLQDLVQRDSLSSFTSSAASSSSAASAASYCPSSSSSSPSFTPPSSPSSPKEKTPFSTYARPTSAQLQDAADAMVYTEVGDLVRFGDLWEGQRTIVCFIRHNYCPSCSDYISSLGKITPEQLRALNLRLVIVGCGSWKMISGYRKILGCSYSIVSDPTRTVYKLLGMTKSTMAAGKRPKYVQHGMTVNTLISLKRGLQMPLKNPGDLGGLGGEFVLGPGLECSYAHRMRNTRDHAELEDILKALGVTISKSLISHLEDSLSCPMKDKPKLQRRPSSAGSGRVVIRVVENP